MFNKASLWRGLRRLAFIPLWAPLIISLSPVSDVIANDATTWVRTKDGVIGIQSTSTPNPFLIAADEAIAIDEPTGDLWIYDNDSFSAYNSNGGLLLTLPVTVPPDDAQLLVDSSLNRIWLSIQNNLYIYDLSGNLLNTFVLPLVNSFLRLDHIHQQLYIASDSEIRVLDTQGTELFQITVAVGSELRTQAWDFSLGELWVLIDDDKMRRYDHQGNITFEVLNAALDGVGFLAADGNGGVWSATDDLLNHFDNQLNLLSGITPFGAGIRIETIVSDPTDQSIWVASDFEVKHFDSAGNVLYSLDTSLFAGESRRVEALELYANFAAPVISIASPADRSIANDPTPAIDFSYSASGSPIDTASLDLTLNNVPWFPPCMLLPNTANCIPVTALLDGRYRLGANISDSRGKVSNLVTNQFTIDTVTPVITVDTPLDNSVTNQINLTISGSISEFASLLIDGITVSLGRGNVFSISKTLAEGSNIINFQATDRAGNIGTETRTVTLDTQIPADPVAAQIGIGAYINGQATITGASGSVEPFAQVVITNQRTGEVITVTADANGAFSALVNGVDGDTYSIVVQDSAGNQSAAIVVGTSTTGALPPVITSTPVINATIDAPYTYQVLANDPNNDPLTYSLTSAPLGMQIDNAGLIAWTPIDDGSHAVTVNVSDGNGGVASQSYTLNVTGAAAQTPALGALTNQTALLGRTLSLQLSATDPSGGSIEYFAEPMPLPANSLLDSNTGLFTFTPAASQVGSFAITFIATNGRFYAEQTITITVPAPAGITQLRGQVLTENDAPLPGVRLEMGGIETTTDANGDFLLDNLPVSGHARLLVDGNAVDPSLGAFATVPEMIDIIAGTENLLEPAIFLLPLDIASADPVDPATTSIITSSRFVEGLSISEPVTLTIPPGAAIDDATGLPYVGDIHISRVTDPSKGPRPLPKEFDLSVYIAIQPFGVTYPVPVPISFPNLEGFPPGSRLDFFALNHDTGEMEKIGEGLVSTDGKTVDSIGGVVKSNSWHGIVPQGPGGSGDNPPGTGEPPPGPGNGGSGNGGGGNGSGDNEPDPPDDPICPACSIDKETGNLKEWHSVPGYYSLQKTRSIRLEYNSNNANPRHILPIISGFGNQAPPPDLMSLRINIGGIDMGSEVFSEVRIEPSSFGQFKTTRPAVQFNATMISTGIQDYELDINCYFPTSRRTTTLRDQIIVRNERNSAFGAGWTISSLQHVYEHSSGGVMLTEGTATSLIFEPLDPAIDPNGFESAPGEFSILTRLPDGSLERRLKDGTRYLFDSAGLMVQEIDRNNNTTSYEYDTQQRLITIIDPVGKAFTLTYFANKLDSISDPLNRVTSFEHDSEGNLIAIIEPNGDRRTFEYEVGKNLMIAQTDQRLNRTEYFYNFADRISKALLPDGSRPQFEIGQTKGLPNPAPEGALGDGSREFPVQAPLLEEEVNNKYIDHNGNLMVEETDIRHRPVRAVDAVGRTYTFARDEDSNITLNTRPNTSIIQSTFDDRGNRLTKREFFNNAFYQYSYDAFSLVTSYTNPNNHTTIYNRDISNGNVLTMVNHLGHTTTYEYDTRGLVTHLVTPNLLDVVYTYNALGLVETMTETPPVGSPGNVRLTQYSYDAAGQTTQTITPDGIILDMEYDSKGRQFRITDNLNQVVEYIYDAYDNLVQTDTKNSNGNLALTVQKIFDNRNRFTDSIRPHVGVENSVTQQILDNNSNITGLTDPNSNNASNQYDGEDRLIENTHRLNGITAYTYDTNDRITQVTAPNGVVTTYTYDVLGRRLTETSPDRGQLSYSYDLNDNVLSATDGRGITTTISYDELERPNAKLYPNTIAGKIEDVTYTYDLCPFGLGKLCQRIDESGIWDYEYDAFGNVVKETRVELGVTYTTDYQYDEGDHITQMTYPTGRVVGYIRDGVRRVETISTGINGFSTNIVSGIQYRGDNKMTQCTFGNGLVDNRDYDLQGRLLNQTLGILDDRSYSYDKNSNMLSRTTTPQNSVYSYDALDRIIGDQIDGNNAFQYQYDLNHNRQTKTQLASLTDGYDYEFATNRIARQATFTTGVLPTTVSDRLYIYSDTNRIFQVIDNGLLSAEYIYNDQGQRTRKVVHDNSVSPVTSKTTLYHYDTMGYLIAETDQTGISEKDYIWAEGMYPMAQVDISAGIDTIHYLHTDHLMTPRFSTNQSQQISWRWEGEAFGETADQTLSTEVNLRFPGQYFDRETGEHYNWNRYYRAGIGRYVTSDPIGLDGGLNSFVYVNVNPISQIDPSGLKPPCVQCEGRCKSQYWAGVHEGVDYCNAQKELCEASLNPRVTFQCEFLNAGCLYIFGNETTADLERCLRGCPCDQPCN